MDRVFGTAGEQADYAMLDGDDWISMSQVRLSNLRVPAPAAG
jgi:hypothetical protein